MKRCSTCKTEKNESEFSQCRTFPDGLSRRCKACDNEYRTVKAARTTQKMQQIVDDLKANGCQNCTESDPCVLDFHHVNEDDKTISVSTLVSKRSFSAFLREVEKCRLLCANCHRKGHVGRFDPAELPGLPVVAALSGR